jgi:polyferredoxin
MKKTLQIITQIIFLALFIVLIAMNKIQLWMGIFGISVILTLFFGRFYCGYMCPMNTVFRFTNFIKKKLKIKSFKVPKFLTKPIVRYISLALFVGIFAFVMITGKKLPVLPALFVLAIIITLFFPESFWHNHLCPYGTILHLTGKKSLFSWVAAFL